MRTTTVVSALGAATIAAAQRPNGTSICDYYSNALFGSTNGSTQYTLLTALVNTAVIGNYSAGAKNAVNGILNKGEYNGTAVNLLPYFSGGLASTNEGGSSGVSVSFLDGGGAAPLMKNMPANDTTSNQYMLLTHLYEYFGALLGCSSYGKTDFSEYQGTKSMYEVHKYMGLDAYQNGYFITQVGLAAASFGVAEADVQAVGMSLNNAFNYRCEPAMAILPGEDSSDLQSICIASSCPEAANANCGAYGTVQEPVSANSSNMASSTSMAMASGTASGTMGGSSASMTASGSSSPATSTGEANSLRLGALGGFMGLFGLVAAL